MVEYIGKETRRMFIKPLTMAVSASGSWVLFFGCFSSVFPKMLHMNTGYLLLQKKKMLLKV